ncbi:MAG: hypothetical protein JWM89_2620 [Acidimicrobiales bacterium]|nr:hypothetical protein [Acidimicrobiales bacterium]
MLSWDDFVDAFGSEFELTGNHLPRATRLAEDLQFDSLALVMALVWVEDLARSLPHDPEDHPARDLEGLYEYYRGLWRQ